MESFIWHHVNEKEKQEIKKEARDILKKFAKALEKVKEEKYEHFENGDGTREESKIEEQEEFKKIFFENAPKKNKNFIIAEKKTW